MVSKDTKLLIPWETKNSNVVFLFENAKKFILFFLVQHKKSKSWRIKGWCLKFSPIQSEYLNSQSK